MQPEKWDRLKQIFTTAVDLPADRLDIFVTEACAGDIELRAEVERLLASSRETGSFIESSMVTPYEPEPPRPQHSLREGDFFARRYRIESLVGSGGMGQVFRALDTRLGRTVAIKVLTSTTSGDMEFRERLVREAQAVARLSHSHICSLFHFDSCEGRDYLVFEFLEGPTLASRLRSGPLRFDELKLCTQALISALAYAHASGVIHRDLKPGNVILTDSGAKLVDFGIARLAGGEDTRKPPDLTSTGAIIGSVSYMSPEQAQGRPVDRRTDIFSLGALLYEAAAGCKAFCEQSAVATLTMIVSRHPAPISNLAPDLPQGVCAVIQKCLRKDPAERYQTMDELNAVIRDPRTWSSDSIGSTRESRPLFTRRRIAWATAALAVCAAAGFATSALLGRRPVARDSLAVLPFSNASSNPELDYLADGLSDALTNALARVPELRVIARTTAYMYKERKEDVRTIGKVLAVGTILTGSVSTNVDGRLRIQADLIDVNTGREVWGKQYQGTRLDALNIEEDMTANVLERLELAQSNARSYSKTAKQTTSNPEAHALYLRGRHALHGYSEADLKRAIEMFNSAISLDATYAEAYAGLADSYTGLSSIYLKPTQAMSRAKAAVQRALELQPELPEASTAMGIIRSFYDYDQEGAERDFATALRLRPNDAWTHLWLGWTRAFRGRVTEGIRSAQRAHELDPLSAFVETGLGQMYYFDGQPEEAVRTLTNVVSLNPAFVPGHLWLGVAYLNQGQFALARQALENARRVDPGLPTTVAYLAYCSGRSGNRSAALKFLNELAEIQKKRYVPYYLFATAYVGLGDLESAMQSLERAFLERDDMLPIVNIDKLLTPLRGDTRFRSLVARCGL